MINKEINIPIFKVKHLIITLGVLVLICINLFQWYVNKDNRINVKNLKQKNKKIDFKFDSITNINKVLEKDLVLKDTLIKFYKDEKTKQEKLRKYYKREYSKAIEDYNSLNRNDRYNAVKELLAE